MLARLLQRDFYAHRTCLLPNISIHCVSARPVRLARMAAPAGSFCVPGAQMAGISEEPEREKICRPFPPAGDPGSSDEPLYCDLSSRRTRPDTTRATG